ncbi:unnamed protein product [Adineta ricciae]|uniref:C2 domain-containing protein n=1 Tax=Adineta ricciae TaxID=249248 RepID=A0A813R0D3_ADIRI|nr:unnamed protein product [Adineta ricciae]
MSSVAIVKRSSTSNDKEARMQLQSQEKSVQDLRTQTSLPPHVDGSVHAILICHVPKLRWGAKYQSLYRSVTVKMAWWGENAASAVFKPEISGTKLDHRQQPNTTVKYYVQSDLQQFSRYLTDATELLLKVHDGETNRTIGTVKVANLSSLSIKNSIKGYMPIFSNKNDKLGELLISLRLFLPGPHDSSEHPMTMSFTSEVSSPPSRRNSIATNDLRQFENGLRTFTTGHIQKMDNSSSVCSSDTNLPQGHIQKTTAPQTHAFSSKNLQPGVQAYKELPTGKVVEELIDRANRLREDMMKSSKLKGPNVKKSNSSNKNSLHNAKNNVEVYGHKSLEIPIDDIDVLADNENMCGMLALKASLKSSGNFNSSILTDLDGLENEDSLLDDLLYGGGDDPKNNTKTQSTSLTHVSQRTRVHNKPSISRSRTSSLTRASGPSDRPRSARRDQSLTRSHDSDSASRFSFNIHNSDFEDSGNETQEEDGLSSERIQLLNYVRTARIRIDYFRLDMLNNRDCQSYSSFGRTNKSKRALTYYIEYQFPVSMKNSHGHVNEATEVVKIASKRFESNNDIIFSHLSTYPCCFNKTTFKNWWSSLLIFKIYSRMSGTTNSEQIGFAVLPLRSIFKANCLHLEQDLNVIDRTQMNEHQKVPPQKVSKKSCIGQIHLMLELDSDEKNFKTELDRVQFIEQSKPHKHRVSKSTRSVNTHVQMPRCFIPNESSSDFTDGLVVQIYLSIVEARNIPKNSSNLPRNPYFVYRAFWNEERITSTACWGTTTPKFNFQQKVPLLLNRSTIEKMHQNYVIVEVWDKKMIGPSDQIIGITKVPLEQFYVSFKDKQISRVLLRAQYPVLSVDSWLPIIDPFNNASAGEIQVLLAMGTPDQISAVQVAHADTESYSSAKNQNALNSDPSASSLIEHYFEIMIESIDGLRAFESMVWGESDCFIQYSFPIQSEQQIVNTSLIKPFQLRTIRTATTLCTSDPTFHDTNRFQYVLSPADALHKYFYTVCQSTTPIDASIVFEVWSRFYHPNIRDQLLAIGKLSAAKLCSMTTMLNADSDDKSMQSFRIPLEIVQEDLHQEQHHYASASTYGGDLSITVTYKRNILKRNESQAIPNRLTDGTSQVCVSIGIIRACGLKHATLVQAQHDARLNYASQVGVNTYAKLSFSFLSDIESRSTRTIARSFVPEYNHSIDFPISLIWSNHRNQSISLAEMLEHGELKVEVFHRMNANEKQATDILLCHSKISLKDLIAHHTGIKGWFSLASALRSEISSDPAEHSVGGIELFARFAQQDDRRRMIDSAKTLGWLDDKYIDQENFLDDEKDLGCLLKISIDRIQFPIELLTQPDKNRVSVFAQYRFYDKMPVITKRKQTTINRNNLICELQFLKEHLFLASAPFYWYLREEKLEIQIWMSENDTYDYTQSLGSSTDKLVGSIFVDLSPLCQRKRKPQRISAILPIFKQGAKNLHGASVQVHISIDSSKDFNELRNPDNVDTSNEAELESYLENRYLNLMNNDRALRSLANSIFSAQINIEQGAHLPNIYFEEKNLHLPPNPYVTYSAADSNHLYRTQVLTSTVRPQWNYQQSVKLSVEHLFDEKKVFILKVWHKLNAEIESIPEKSGDKVLGFVAIDLSPLLSGLQQISGWYNISDVVGNVQGQLKISIVPLEDLVEFKRLRYNSKHHQPKLDSHRSNSSNVPTLVLSDLSARSNTGSQISLNTSAIEDDSHKESFLMNNLRRQLSELDVITDRLKARYYSNSEISSELPSSRSTNTLSSTILPLSTHHQKDPTPEPTVNYDLSVTNILSLHNDQVRLAQELMSKASHLLETSKDFFVRSLTPPPSSSASTSMENIITPTKLAPSSPPALPNFNNTHEFEATIRSPHVDSSPQHHNRKRNSNAINATIWSNGNHYDHHNSVVSPSTYPDHIDLVHIRPLNDLSTFNFDCQQTKAERLNTYSMNDATTDHNTMSPEAIIH